MWAENEPDVTELGCSVIRQAARRYDWPLVAEGVVTKADPGAAGWAIRDAVTQLRRCGADTIYPLDGSARLLAGTAKTCAIRIDEGLGASREHASFERRGDEWVVTDLQSTNGTRQDGEDRATFVLAPGMEIELGSAKLIAESPSSIMVAAFLRRLLGWAHSNLAEVDSALQTVRQMAHLRSALIVIGDGPLLGVARRLHRLVLGDARPFSIHGRRESGSDALDRARDGMLVLDAEHLPSDLKLVLATSRLPDRRVRLLVGAATEKLASHVAARVPSVGSFAIPPLSSREDEIDRLLLEYADDAAVALSAPGRGLRPHDLQWIRKPGIKNHDEADEVMTRVVAVRNWGVSGGASRLGLTHGALSKYFARRKIPT